MKIVANIYILFIFTLAIETCQGGLWRVGGGDCTINPTDECQPHGTCNVGTHICDCDEGYTVDSKCTECDTGYEEDQPGSGICKKIDSLKCGIQGKSCGDPKTYKQGIKTSNECLKLCSEGELLKGCTWVSFNEVFSTCWLYETSSCTEVVNAMMVSYQVECYIECPIKPGICNPNIGFMKQTFGVTSIEACYVSCKTKVNADDGCKTVTFLTAPGGAPGATLCQLFRKCSYTPNSYDVNVETYGRALTGSTVEVNCKHYLLLTGGSGYKADLIHLVTDDQESCVLTDSTILDNTWYATGGIYKKDIYSCGGSLARAGAASVESYNCAIYSNEPDKKPIVIPLRQSRIKASSAILEDKIYIVGGSGSHYAARIPEIITTEIKTACMTGLDDKGCLTEIGPTLPDNAPIEGHCMVTFNKEIWLIGGLTNKEPTEKTYKLNTAANPAKWEPQATLKTPRANHGCATYVTGDKEVIVVAGGFGKSSKRASNLVALDTVEFLTDPAAITFTESANKLVTKLAYMSMISTSTGVIVSGGRYDENHDWNKLYSLDCGGKVDDCSTATWVEKGTISPARSGKLGILTPAEYLDCA